jgi:hypothetical protein
MTREEVVAYRLAHPFVPFSIRMKDGTRHEVRESTQLAVGPRGCLLGFPARVDALVHLAIGEMARIRPLDRDGVDT